MQSFEQLGTFYLGRTFDLEARRRSDDLVLYDAKDLVTHAVVVGMTGSGKTGLCINLIEEAAIDGVPVIAIDPKGDLANLLLAFPELRPEDFRPWINEDDAARKGLSPDAYAAAQADLWRTGLAAWGQGPDRIARLRAAAEFAVYTPGSSAGLPVSVLRTLDPPEGEVEPELLRERIGATATSLLALVGITADPITSREHILLSTIIQHAWAHGRSLDLPTLIGHIQHPPVTRVGVMELEAFYPGADRFALAMALNALLASPGFASWMEGDPLDISKILWTPSGKPRVAIFSIAHLSDPERMFFVTLLLSHVLSWTRAQSGTTSLRAILYMDEIAGYVPPVAEPPSKRPLLTLMKQARAYGVGVVLATQNPVDLDYKGLSNAGTWFIGRLQTERDKARVLDGLEGAVGAGGGAFDRAAVDRTLSQLGARVFLMNNVHEDHPVVFETRWAMSYLRGPLTRSQLRALRDARAPRPEPTPVTPGAPAPPPASTPTNPAVAPTPASPGASAPPAPRPVLDPAIAQFFLPARADGPPGARLVYTPMLLASATVSFTDAKAQVDTARAHAFLVPLGAGPAAVLWDKAAPYTQPPVELDAHPIAGGVFDPLPADAAKPRAYDAWRKEFVDFAARSCRLDLLRAAPVGLLSRPDEPEREFRLRVTIAARERRDALAEKLRAKYAPKLATLQDRLRRARQQVDAQQHQAREARAGAAVSFGSVLLGALLGRKTLSQANIGRAAGAMRGVGRSARERADVERAEETVEAVQARIVALEQELAGELDASAARFSPDAEPLETVTIRPKKAGVQVRSLVLAWAPYWESAGARTPAFAPRQ
ncbi:MAG: DUF87 domain-containing protein [Planctomycetota bacterium]|nr:DUF87 domain-containing protein [Planctomycetota bacterium]